MIEGPLSVEASILLSRLSSLQHTLSECQSVVLRNPGDVTIQGRIRDALDDAEVSISLIQTIVRNWK